MKSHIENKEIVVMLDGQPSIPILQHLIEKHPDFVRASPDNKHYTIESNIRIKAPECNMPIVFGMFGENENMRTTFKGKVVLQCQYFNSDVYFQNCEFDIFIADDCIFKGNVHFDRAKFNDGGYFGVTNSIFMQKVGFCDVEFKEIPNFSRVSFEKIDLVNFVGVKIADSFDKVQRLIKKTAKPIGISKDLRGSFRTIRHSLGRQDNIIDASNFHKLELYCKEIELDSKLNSKESKKFSRDWIDSLVLKFYRHTSDHHTDLLKILGWVIALIALYGLVLFRVRYGEIDLENFMRFLDNHKDNKFANFLKSELENIAIGIMYLFGILCVFIEGVLFYLLYDFPNLKVFIRRCCQILKFCIAIRNMFIVLCIVYIVPEYIIPAINIFTDKRSILDPLSIIGAIYTIFFALMLYSFIETARKNSIVPS